MITSELEDKRLDAFGLTNLELILEELFLIPPEALRPAGYCLPQTIGELSAVSKLSAAEVAARLEKLVLMSKELEITCAELRDLLAAGDEKGIILLDVREPWEYQICHLPGSLLLVDYDFAELLPRLRQAALVITVCHHGIRSLSAALFLRQHGVSGAKSMTGGVDAWAKTVDKAMARY